VTWSYRRFEKWDYIRRENETDRFIETPGMNAICKWLATGLKIHYQAHVAPLLRVDGRWCFTGKDNTELGAFDVVIISAPAIQMAALLPDATILAATSSFSFDLPQNTQKPKRNGLKPSLWSCQQN